MASDLEAMASNVETMASNLETMASNLETMASDLEAMASNVETMATKLETMASKLLAACRVPRHVIALARRRSSCNLPSIGTPVAWSVPPSISWTEVQSSCHVKN